MKVLLLAALLVCATARIVPVSLYGRAQDRVEGEYLVHFGKDRTSIESFERFKTMKAPSLDPKSIVVHEFSNYRGFWAKLTEDQLAIVQQMEGVETIEANVRGWLDGEQSPATWGIDRSDQRTGTNNIYRWRDDAAGQGVGVYVLDTGVFSQHPDFNGRASFGADCSGSSQAGEPCNTEVDTGDSNGHGTHCAGTVGSSLYGVAKNTTIFNVRVVGPGVLASNFINGVNFVVNHKFDGVKIMSISLGYPPSSAINSAVDAAFNAGVLSINSAGNGNTDECHTSPTGADSAFVVAASDINDQKADFSSYGQCVDIWAPGVDILSLTPSGGTAVDSGTSMAAPHVAGAAALIASRGITDPGQIRDTLIAEATVGIVNGVPDGVANRLLFTSPQ